MKTKLFLIALATVFSVSSCKKDEDDDQPDPIVQPELTPDPAPNPIVFDNYADSVIAVQSEFSTIAGTITIGTAVAGDVVPPLDAQCIADLRNNGGK